MCTIMSIPMTMTTITAKITSMAMTIITITVP
jgi:hypothetical protein